MALLKKNKMKTYKITITETATYVIESKDLKKAKELAFEYFYEKEPDIKIEETDEQAEYSIFPTQELDNQECIVFKKNNDSWEIY